MSDQPTAVRIAQGATVFLTTVATGAGLGLSAFVVPRLLESPTPLMLQQTRRTLLQGRALFPAASALTAIGYFFLASRTWIPPSRSLSARLYLVAGALCASIVPYTLVVVMPTNRRLLRKAEETRLLDAGETYVELCAREETAKYLVDQWGMLNLGRVLIWGTAGILGLSALV
jgi:hypothetical protein